MDPANEQAMMAMGGGIPDPMAMERQMMNIPSEPVGGAPNFIELVTTDRDTPREIRTEYWDIFAKDNILTFLDQERKDEKLINADIITIDRQNSMYYYDYTFEKEALYNKLRNVLETKLDRATGTKDSNRKNERTMLQSQFTENRSISEVGGMQQNHGKFLTKLLGRR